MCSVACVNWRTAVGDYTDYPDHDEGPGMLSSLAFWVGGSIGALVCWTLIWVGIAHALDYFN